MEKDNISSSSELSKFNSSSDILQMISYLKYQAIDSYNKGDLESWFYNWKQIKFVLIGRIKDDEDTYLKLEKNIAYLLINQNKNNGYKKLLIRHIEIYLAKLQRQIEVWGMGIVNREDESHFA